MMTIRRRSVLWVAGVATLVMGAFTIRTALTDGPSGSSIQSNRGDYAPGEIATLSGGGFQPLESIRLGVSIDQPVTGLHVGDASLDPLSADADGGFVTEYEIPSEADGMILRVTAVGASSGLTATTVLNNPARVFTDLDDYPPGATVYISGGGFLANETVQLQVLHVGWLYGEHADSDAGVDGEGDDTWTVLADENGNLIDATWYVCLDDCSGALLELTATGLTSRLTAKRRFTDLAFGLFENPARTIKRDAFAWGSPVYARITQARNDTCYRVQWVDPGGAVATHDLPGTSGLNGNGDRDDSFPVPPAGPSGIWTARMSSFASGNFGCTGSPALQAALTFDVARAVVIGAGTTGTDSVGGDNDVSQNQASTVQGGGTGASLSVASASGSKNKRTLLRFDLTGSGISGTVTDAKLRLLMASSPNNSRTHNARRVTVSWAENTITWNNQSGVAVGAADAQKTGTV